MVLTRSSDPFLLRNRTYTAGRVSAELPIRNALFIGDRNFLNEYFCLVTYYFGEIKNELFLKNELLFKDPEDVYSRSARPSASYTY